MIRFKRIIHLVRSFRCFQRNALFAGVRLVCVVLFSFVGFLFSQNNPANLSSPLQVTRQPKPSYTDSARRNNVNGHVLLQVSFLEDGTIGDVYYISESSKKKKLTKYGLAAQAIAASKLIKFVPERDEKGNAITVIRNVQYHFTIY